MVVKLLVGVLGRSDALIADGLHSGADVFSSVAVWVGLRIAGRPPDAGHQYGHAKAEAISQKVASVILLLAGLEVANSAVAELSRATPTPSWWTLWVAIGAMLPKAYMAYRQRRLARESQSHAMLAAAVDNQTDALSSLIAGLGILSAKVGMPLGESLAALMVAAMVMWAGVEIFRTAAQDLMDPACDEATQAAIRRAAEECPGVVGISQLRSRMSGREVLVDLEIDVNRNLSLLQAHAIAHQVQDRLLAMDRVAGVTVHVNPAPENERA